DKIVNYYRIFNLRENSRAGDKIDFVNQCHCHQSKALGTDKIPAIVAWSKMRDRKCRHAVSVVIVIYIGNGCRDIDRIVTGCQHEWVKLEIGCIGARRSRERYRIKTGSVVEK